MRDARFVRDRLTTPLSSTGDAAADARRRQRFIGEELRRWYDSVRTEPVPDEWLSLLDWAEEDLKP